MHLTDDARRRDVDLALEGHVIEEAAMRAEYGR